MQLTDRRVSHLVRDPRPRFGSGEVSAGGLWSEQLKLVSRGAAHIYVGFFLEEQPGKTQAVING